jgi:hypothetical protein
MNPDMLIVELNHRVEELSRSRRQSKLARLLRK